ncbi:MAG: hypothetical protein SV186_01235 [Candidatus Nanohaloarchaea archaeon]|nr:hypothetical protein [Candidatus Nanohaloarchaea archaeon]
MDRCVVQMTDRKGISFTLTMVVVGVILFITAVSIITLSGGTLQSFFNWAGQAQGETQQTAAVREACYNLADDANQEYCQMYVANADDGYDCTSTNPRRQLSGDTTYEDTATEAGCKWTNYKDAIVTVDGSEYNCIDQGYIQTSFCPAQTASQ